MYSSASVWETFLNSVQTPAMHALGEATPSTASWEQQGHIFFGAVLWITANRRNVLSQSSGCMFVCLFVFLALQPIVVVFSQLGSGL
jgi:hypothetical protein